MNSKPKPPLKEWTIPDLIEELCLQLRHVGCSDAALPDGEYVRDHLERVRAVHAELTARGAKYEQRLQRLSVETQWQIPKLLEECLAYPAQLPYVRQVDGVRPTLQCQLCEQSERPIDARLFFFCNTCMRKVLQAMKDREPFEGINVFRTYNSECRCEHADSETVLVCEQYPYDVMGVCEKCVLEELTRRES